MTVHLDQTPEGWTATWPDAGISVRAAGTGSSVETDGDLIRVIGHTAEDGRFVVLDAVADLDPATSTRLVNGYQSWDYCGVRPASEAGHTWWGGALACPSGGLAFLSATGDRLATSVRTEPADGGVRLVALAGGTPDLVPAPGSWGFRPSEATPIDLATCGVLESEPLLITASPDPFTAMEAVAEATAAASGALAWHAPPILGWESWYHYGFSVTPEVVLTNGRLMRERYPERFALLQIDDGWQRGYGDWRPGEGWPGDLGDLVTRIEALGCFAGLWLAPFMVQPGTGIGERPELLIGDPSSEAPLHDRLMARHGIDATHPAALDWLAELGAQVRAWGFRMVKLDFLYIGAQEGRRHDPSVTGTEALRRGLRAFTDGLGEATYVLGCGMPFLPAVGLCHGNRIGGDLAAPIIWPVPELVPFPPEEGWQGIPPTARNVAARWWSHGRLFHNDPDVVMACGPDEGPPYTVEEARVLAALGALCGGPFFLADDLAALSPAKRAVLEDPALLGLAWNEGARPLDLFDRPDTSPEPEFYRQPSTLPRAWTLGSKRMEFDWAAHSAREEETGGAAS